MAESNPNSSQSSPSVSTPEAVLHPPSVSTPEAVLHPSLGQSGYLVSYLPLPLHEASSRRPPQQQRPLLVTIPPASIPTIFAHRQWRAGMLLADLIHSEVIEVKGLKILELGAGTGLPGISSALKQKVEEKSSHQSQKQKVGIKTGGFTVITDYDEPCIVKTLKENVIRNLGQDHALRLKSNTSGGVRVVGHRWAKSLDDLLDSLPSRNSLGLALTGSSTPSLFDKILLADCLWDSLSHSDLLRTITSTLSKTPESRVTVISGLHTGRETLVSFIRKAFRAGLKLRTLSIGLKDEFTLLEEKLDSETVSDETDPLYQADEIILEVELSGQDELVAETSNGKQSSEASLPEQETPTKLSGNEDTLSPSQNGDDAEKSRRLFIEAHHHRLTGKRRKFVVEQRDEERKEKGGVKHRNRWITMWCLGWKEELL